MKRQYDFNEIDRTIVHWGNRHDAVKWCTHVVCFLCANNVFATRRGANVQCQQLVITAALVLASKNVQWESFVSDDIANKINMAIATR